MNRLRSRLTASTTGNRDDLEGAAARSILHASSVSPQERESVEERADRIFVQDEVVQRVREKLEVSERRVCRALAQAPLTHRSLHR